MKIHNLALVTLISLSFVACNKDGDIVIEGTEPTPEVPESPEIKMDYIVMEYTPAPGQYINEVANGSSKITSQEQACEYAASRLAASQYVSLGSWGGYIMIKFNEPVKNSGSYDFSIGSNAFDSSNEPGIVWVMTDSNKNGVPDDTWYELKGSHFGKEGYERNYWVTYFRPQAKGNTKWEDSNGETGEIEWLGAYHDQEFYYPAWITESSYTLYGSKLPHQAEQNPVTGIWINKPFEWGYADNFGEDFFQDGRKNLFMISNAVSEDNEPVNLESIDFVKVQTAVNNSSGWLGENSTEVSGFFIEN